MESPMSALTASPAKLRDGSWGARVQGAAKSGDTVTIRASSGKAWDARIAKVLWTGDGVSLCSTTSLDRGTSSRSSGRGRGTWTGCSCGSVEEFGKRSDCESCRFDRD
jgi:hypothetical protein